MEFDSLDEGGLTISDPIENAHFELYTATSVTVQSIPTEQ